MRSSLVLSLLETMKAGKKVLVTKQSQHTHRVRAQLTADGSVYPGHLSLKSQFTCRAAAPAEPKAFSLTDQHDSGHDGNISATAVG